MSTESKDRYALFREHIQRSFNGQVDESQVKSFFDSIISHKNGENILDSVLKREGSFDHRVAVKADSTEDFRASTSAEGRLLNLWFYTQLDLTAGDIKRRFLGNGFGVVLGFPAGALL